MCGGLGINSRGAGHEQQQPPQWLNRQQRQHQRVKKVQEKGVTPPTRFDWQLIPGKFSADTHCSGGDQGRRQICRKQKISQMIVVGKLFWNNDNVGEQWDSTKASVISQSAVFAAVAVCQWRVWRQADYCTHCDGGLFIDLARCVYASDLTSTLHLLRRGERESCCFWLSCCSLCVCVCVFIPVRS